MKSVTSLIDSICITYDNDFIEHEIANRYYNVLEEQLEYNNDKDSMVTVFGKRHHIPRKQVGYGVNGLQYNFSGCKVQAKSWLEQNEVCKVILDIRKLVEQYTDESFNFVLINRYNDGNDFIGYHRDDEKELVKESSIVSVSLGSKRDILFKSIKKTRRIDKLHKIELNHGSILIIKYPTNEIWKHSIPKRRRIDKPRISLTFRNMIIY
jgi:alkylated DNA repair dioxygenase AlkB